MLSLLYKLFLPLRHSSQIAYIYFFLAPSNCLDSCRLGNGFINRPWIIKWYGKYKLYKNFNINVDTDANVDARGSAIVLPGLRPGNQKSSLGYTVVGQLLCQLLNLKGCPWPLSLRLQDGLMRKPLGSSTTEPYYKRIIIYLSSQQFWAKIIRPFCRKERYICTFM